jgi:hypothetical protein
VNILCRDELLAVAFRDLMLAVNLSYLSANTIQVSGTRIILCASVAPSLLPSYVLHSLAQSASGSNTAHSSDVAGAPVVPSERLARVSLAQKRPLQKRPKAQPQRNFPKS